MAQAESAVVSSGDKVAIQRLEHHRTPRSRVLNLVRERAKSGAERNLCLGRSI